MHSQFGFTEARCLCYPGNNTLAETDTHRLDAMERHTIVKVLEETKGDKIAAARILGIGKTTIYRKLRQYGQNPS